MATNECIPYKEPGGAVTGQASAAVTGKRCLAITGDIQPDGSLTVAHAAAAGRIVGVSKYDAASGAKVGIHRGSKIVVPITSGAAITAFTEVEVGTLGRVIPLAAGRAIGYAETGVGGADLDARICLY